MFSRKNSFREKLHSEKGSTLITVLVATTFLVLLGAMILMVSTANLQTKQIAYLTQKNFYEDERVLDDLYNGIGQKVSGCLSVAYTDVLSQAVDPSGNNVHSVYKTEEDAYKAFAWDFVGRLKNIYAVGDSTGQPDDPNLVELNSYTQGAASGAVVKSYSRVRVTPEVGLPEELTFEDVLVQYKQLDEAGQETGYQSSITTDIVVQIPYVTFFRDSSRILDYAIAANQGIYLRDGYVNVSGNVYAGTAADETTENKTLYMDQDVYGGINCYAANVSMNGNYLISKGDINVRKSELTLGSGAATKASASIWAESLRTIANRNDSEPSQITVLGKTYLSNDLELNANQSKVSLGGEFYAYNNGRNANPADTMKTAESEALESQYVADAGGNRADHALNSAVIINGASSELDLSGLDTFVTAGVAYVDLHSSAYDGGNSGKYEEYRTGESVALKSNQYLYLAPTSCMNVSNPCRESEAATATWTTGASGWFGTDLGYVNSTTPFVPKVFSGSGASFTYFFLNFESGKEEEYVRLVLNMKESDLTAPAATSVYYTMTQKQREDVWALKTSIQTKAVGSAVASTITGYGTDARVYTKGNIVGIEGTTESAYVAADANQITLPQVSVMGTNFYKHYQYLYYLLDPMESYNNLDAIDPADIKVMTPDGTYVAVSQDTLPIGYYVDIDSLVDNGTSHTYSGYKVWIRNGDCVIDSDFNGILLCRQNVTINPGVTFNGMMIAGGRIYVKGGTSADPTIINADRSIVETIIRQEYAQMVKGKRADGGNNQYATYYLRDYTPQADAYERENKGRVTGTDYTDYISYRNWRKGESVISADS